MEDRMELPRDMYELSKAFEHRLVLRKLRPHGIGSIVFGVIALFMGISGMRENILNVVLAWLGLVLFVEGIWLIKSPSPAGFIVDGCMLILLGIWNLLVTYLNGGASPFSIIGFLQIYWGINSFKDSSRASAAISFTTSLEDIKKADSLLDAVFKSNFKTNQNYIEFRQNDFLTDQPWKGVLVDGYAVLVGLKKFTGAIISKEEIIITQKGKYTPGKSYSGTTLLGGKEASLVIPSKSLERLQTWKPEILQVPTTV